MTRPAAPAPQGRAPARRTTSVRPCPRPAGPSPRAARPHERRRAEGDRAEHRAVHEQRLHPPAQSPLNTRSRLCRPGLRSCAANAAWRLPTSSSSASTRAPPPAPRPRAARPRPGAATDQGRPQLPSPAGQLHGRRAHHHDHVLAQPDQLLQGPVAELVQAAQDDMAAGSARLRTPPCPYLLPKAETGTGRQEFPPVRWLSPTTARFTAGPLGDRDSVPTLGRGGPATSRSCPGQRTGCRR